jgi:hypothetical protein
MHLGKICKGPIAVFENVVMPQLKMVITDVPAVSHVIYSISQLVNAREFVLPKRQNQKLICHS